MLKRWSTSAGDLKTREREGERQTKDESGRDSSRDSEVVRLVVSVETINGPKERENRVQVRVCVEGERESGWEDTAPERRQRLTAVARSVEPRRSVDSKMRVVVDNSGRSGR